MNLDMPGHFIPVMGWSALVSNLTPDFTSGRSVEILLLRWGEYVFEYVKPGKVPVHECAWGLCFGDELSTWDSLPNATAAGRHSPAP